MFFVGKLVNRRKLSYAPHWWNALGSNGGWLFVAESRSPCIHVHDLDGEELACFTHSQLGLEEGDMVWALGCGDGGVLQIAVGANDMWKNQVNSIHAYQVRFPMGTTCIILP